MTEARRKVLEGYLTMTQAREQLGVSRVTMARLVRDFDVQVYEDPRDARVKLLRAEDVERMLQPRPRTEGKAAA